MLRFELFDETGKLHPRKVLFSAETSPERANSVLTKLFGGLMKWNARRWAENYLTGFQRKAGDQHSVLKGQVQQLLANIRKTGSVQTKPFFTMAAQLIQAEKSAKAAETAQANGDNKGRPFYAPHIINSDDVVSRYLPGDQNTTSTEPGKASDVTDVPTQRRDTHDDTKGDADLSGSEDDHNASGVTDTGILDTLSDQPTDRDSDAAVSDSSSADAPSAQLPEHTTADSESAHQYVRSTYAVWERMGHPEQAPPIIRDAERSGFLDYCETGRLPTRDADRKALEGFVADHENNWPSWRQLLSAAQYAALTADRDQLLKDLAQERAQPPPFKDHAPVDPRHQLHDIPNSPLAQTEPAAHDVIVQKYNEFLELSRGKLVPPALLDDPVSSGFIDYCKHGPAWLPHLDLDTIDQFIGMDDKKWARYQNILSAAQFNELSRKRAELIVHSQAARASVVPVRQPDSASYIPRSEPGETQAQTAIFSALATITLEDALSINWDATDLSRKLGLDDARKIRDLLDRAETSDQMYAMARQILTIAKRLEKAHIEQRLLTAEEDAPQGSGSDADSIHTMLSRAASEFFRRFNAHQQDAQAGKQQTAATLPSDAPVTKDHTAFLQNFRDQPDDARALIDTMAHSQTSPSPPIHNPDDRGDE